DPEARIARVGREVTRVDRADARATQDVDARHPTAEMTWKLLEQVAEDTDLVRAARATAREHERGATRPGRTRCRDGERPSLRWRRRCDRRARDARHTGARKIVVVDAPRVSVFQEATPDGNPSPSVFPEAVVSVSGFDPRRRSTSGRRKNSARSLGS